MKSGPAGYGFTQRRWVSGSVGGPVAEMLRSRMDSVPQKELRNQVGEVLRRVEAGETLTVTVAGRPVAELSPPARRRWVAGSALAKAWRGPVPRGLDDDLAQFEAELVDPFPT